MSDNQQFMPNRFIK